MGGINLLKSTTSLTPASLPRLNSGTIEALYLHVPFCLKKCHYCDFYSVAESGPEAMSRYIDAVLHEASWWQEKLIETGSRTQTVFFGGGTPSMLPQAEMERLLLGLRRLIPLTDDVEWTIEANPASMSPEYCRMLAANGVNRLSIGVQSFVDGELQTLGRIHSASDAIATIREAQSSFSRVSIDLIYAVPGQTLDSWRSSLEIARGIDIGHISCYCLTLEEETPMWRLTRAGRLPEVPEEVQLSFMRTTRAYLTDSGLLPYEISNYAKPGEECRHNRHYWRGHNYLGLGPAAASHFAGLRWRNAPNVTQYLNEVPKGALPVTDVEQLTPAQRATELIMLALRTAEGVSTHDLRELGLDSLDQFYTIGRRLELLGLLHFTDEHACLTESGVYVADSIIGELVRSVT